MPPDSIDPASLDRFVDSLLEAGFEPVGDGRRWRGPTRPSLKPITASKTLQITVRDGWPFVHPLVSVDGLPLGRHRNADGDICLWDVGDSSMAWRDWAGVAARIDDWAAGATGAATADDPSLDPHLTFTGARAGLATIDLTGVEIRDFDSRPIRGKKTNWGLEVGDGEERGRWYDRDRPQSPPQSLDDVRAELRRRQQEDLDEQLETVGQPEGISFLVFAWRTPAGPNLLILSLTRTNDRKVEARAYEAARTDLDVRRLRAGRDAPLVADKSAIVFGVGAVGSHVASLIARSGLGAMRLVDGDVLRPGDLARHAANDLFVGKTKVDAVSMVVFLTARWTKVDTMETRTWRPSELREMIAKVDVVIDTVGSVGFTAQMSRLARAAERPLVSAALYRRGAVGRVRVQSAQSEIKIADRGHDGRFLTIPPSAEEEEVAWETGCAAPVAEAPPSSVMSIGATAARETINVLVGRENGDLDVIECYQAFDASPFDEPCLLRCRA